MSIKTRIYRAYLTLISFLFICNVSVSQSIYQNECAGISNDGNITLKIWNPDKGKRYKMENAQKDAIRVILHNGIASNKECVGQKPLLKTSNEKKEFERKLNNFFEKNGEWHTYTHSSKIATTLPEKIGEKDWKVYQVTVNRNLLKKYLEEKEVIKPIKSGF